MSGCCAPDPAEDRDGPYRRLLWIALVANGVMFVVELAASLVGDSMSLQADALDFLSDAANYGLSLGVLGMGVAARARAAQVKAASMALLGAWVLANAVWRALHGSDPEPFTMGAVAVLALVVNVSVAVMLFSHRGGDANRRSVWLCSRNDAIGNVAVLAAALAVAGTASRWPDLLVAIGIAGLATVSAVQVLRQARSELDSVGAAGT